MSNVNIDEMAKLLGANVRRMRLDRGWSQADLAERMSEGREREVHVPFVSSLERGHRKPTMDTLARLSEVFAVAPGELLAKPEATPA